MTCIFVDASDWPDHGRDVELERIRVGLSKLMEMNIAEPFLAPVSLEAYPDYMKFIGYPIDMHTIRERLANGYYRRVDAILWDIHKIEWNAQLYRKYIDDKTSDRIVHKATLLVDVLNAFVSDHTLTDPMGVYMKLAAGVCVESVTAASSSSQVSTPSKAGSGSKSMNRRKSKRRCQEMDTTRDEVVIPDQAEDVSFNIHFILSIFLIS
jgi:bromodomain and WD repeat domain-containing protein 1/3